VTTIINKEFIVKFLKSNIGKKVFFIEWNRSFRNSTKIVESGILTNITDKKISINDVKYDIKNLKDFCTLASRGDVSDSWIEIYHSEEDVKKQKNASESRRMLDSHCKEFNRLGKLSLDQVERMLSIMNEK
jgi:hypothetical protein